MEQIPVFPLETILFPGMPLQLHIFEKRYRIMVEEALQTEPVFGISLIKKGDEAYDLETVPYSIGTIARIVEMETLDNGQYIITVIGENRFQINALHHDKPYLSASISDFPLEYKRPLDVYRRIRPLRRRVKSYLKIMAQLGEGELDMSQIELPDDPISLLYLAASLLQIPAHEKMPILASANAVAVCMAVERLYRRENAVLENILHISEMQARSLSYLN